MSNLRIKHPTKQLTGNITLPASKSICNRVLVLNKVLYSNTVIQNISTADDCVIMQHALQQTQGSCVRVSAERYQNIYEWAFITFFKSFQRRGNLLQIGGILDCRA